MPKYADSIPRALDEKIGENPSVLDFGSVADLIIANDGVTVATDATFTSSSAAFKSSDVGKRIVIYGAGANTGRESLLREGSGVPTTTSTNTVVSGTSIDCQSASKLILAVAAATSDIKYSLFGGDAADFSDEVSILGPTTVAAAAWDYQTVTTPAKRYYRVKVQDAVGGTHGTAYISLVAFGYLLGTTIASVNSPTSVELATPASATLSNARWFYGTDNTAALQAGLNSVYDRLNISGGDGGGTLYLPPGQYLISDRLDIPKKIELRGANMAASAIFADPEAWPDTEYMVSLGDATDSSPAISTRIVDLRLNGNHAPCSGVYSQQAQESSGVFRCSIVGWRYKGIRFYLYGCQHWTLEELWVFPSSIAINDASVIGVELEQTISSNPINKATVYGQGGFAAGKGTAIRVLNCNVALYDIHTENALKGIHFDTGSTGTVSNNTGHPLVDSSVYITTTNDVAVQNSSANGSKNNVYDAVAGAGIPDSRVSQYLCGAAPYYFRGPSNSGARIVNIVPGNFSSGVPTTFFDGRGGLATDGANPANPNVVTLNPINFGGAAQGGFLSVNSRIASFPNWEQTSTNASTLAMFMRLGASLFELRFGNAANSQGTDPGTRAFAVDAAKTLINRLWFQAGGELPIGNDLGIHRLRLYHGDTGQARFKIQRSQDSGATWADAANFFLDANKVEIIGDLYLQGGIVGVIVISGDPEGTISAGPGTLGLGTDGQLWFKTGSGTTGWVAVGGTDIKAMTLTLDGAHPFIKLNKSGVPKFEMDEDGNADFKGFAKMEGGASIQGVGFNPPLIIYNTAGTEVARITDGGLLEITNFSANSGNASYFIGLTPNRPLMLDNVTKIVTPTTVVDGTQLMVESATVTNSDPLPAAIDTTGMTGDALTVATAVNNILSALGAGGTVVKTVAVVGKTLTANNGIIESIA